MIDKVVNFSREQSLTHVPSALSMLTYVDNIFNTKKIIPRRDRIVLGKPFGSQAYYVVWKELGYLPGVDISKLSVGVKHAEIDFVDYGEETMGNALGVAIGIAYANPSQRVWVNITDATLQMGSTLEALQYIGHNQITNIIVTVDYNNMQVTGSTRQVLTVDPTINMCSEYGWNVRVVDGHDTQSIHNSWIHAFNRPVIYFYKTIKGYGVDYMVNDPVKWHYRPIED